MSKAVYMFDDDFHVEMEGSGFIFYKGKQKVAAMLRSDIDTLDFALATGGSVVNFRGGQFIISHDEVQICGFTKSSFKKEDLIRCVKALVTFDTEDNVYIAADASYCELLELGEGLIKGGVDYISALNYMKDSKELSAYICIFCKSDLSLLDTPKKFADVLTRKRVLQDLKEQALTANKTGSILFYLLNGDVEVSFYGYNILVKDIGIFTLEQLEDAVANSDDSNVSLKQIVFNKDEVIECIQTFKEVFASENCVCI